MQIVIVSSGLSQPYGGSAQSESQLAVTLARRHQVTVLCPAERLDTAFCAEKGLTNVVPFTPNDAVSAYLSPAHPLRKILSSADVCHINGHWRWETFFLTRICLHDSVPYILHPRGMFLVGHRKRWLKRAFNLLIGNRITMGAAKVIALSRFETRQFGPYPILDERVVVLPNGIPFPAAKAKAPSPRPRPYLVYLGRLEARKNLLFLVEAFAQIARNLNDVDLCLVGPEERGYAEKVRQAAARFGVSDRVVIVPPAYGEEKWQYLQNAIALLYPTLHEPFGRVPFEGIAAGTPPIVPDASGSAEYLDPWFREFIYTEGSLDSLASAMERSVRWDVAARDRAVAAAQVWMQDALDVDTLIAKVEALYISIVPNPPRSQRVRIARRA